jgi:septum formation protein
MKLILASTSPRRRELLQFLKIPFEVYPPKFEELSDISLSPPQEAILFARKKAQSLGEDFPNSLIIGCDTLIECEGEKIGKPKNSAEAIQILQKLSARTHYIYTGLAILNTSTSGILETVSQVKVAMFPLDIKVIESYVATGEPLGKAGAYAIQGMGRKLIHSIQGDYFAAVGLPIRNLAEFLARFSVQTEVDLGKIYREAEI